MGDGDSCKELETEYNTMYFFRNICCPLLAKLLANELKNSNFIERSQDKDIDDTLFDTLKKVNSSGKNKRKKMKKDHQETATDTYEINNLKDNEEILNQVKMRELRKRDKENEAVLILQGLDVKFLLCVLVNCILDITFTDEVKGALNALRELRNSNTHRDGDTELQKKLWEETEKVHKYLHGDSAAFKEQRKSCWPEETWHKILEDVRKEIDERYQTSSPEHHTAQFTILYHQYEEYCQPGTPVQNLLDFIVEKQKSCCHNPRPIVLYGEPGAGKSFVLDCLVDTLRQQSSHEDFLMVIKVGNTNVKSKEEFWNQIFTDRCPQAFRNHSVEEVQQVLRFHASKFLFLVDCNLQNQETLNKLISYMGHGLWVLSFQGALHYSKRFHLLEVAPLSEEQIHQMLQGRPGMTESDRDLVLRLFNDYEHKDLIKTPEIVHLFADIYLEKRRRIPFYELIQCYIHKKVKIDETKLIEMGKEAFQTIKKSNKYYSYVNSDLRPLFTHDPRRGYFFKYRKVEDYLAAKYVVANPKEACDSWLSQATLFTTVFHVVCFLWCEQDDGIQTNQHYIREYLETIIWGDRARSTATSNNWNCKVKKRKQDEANIDGKDFTGKKRKRCEATSEGKDCQGKKRQYEATSEVKDCQGKKGKTEATGVGRDCVNIHKPFERWICLSKFARDYQSNDGLLKMLAEMLTPFKTWLFRYTTLTTELIDGLSLVLKHVRLTKKLTIKMESGTNVTVLKQLWTMLSSHSRLLNNTPVHLVIHYQDNNVTKYKEDLTELCDMILASGPLSLTQYSGPLLCSRTRQFSKSLCLQNLSKLDVFITDLDSLSMVLEQNENQKCLTRLRVKLREMRQPLEQLLSFPPDLTIIYFEGLQMLLDSYKPDSLRSLRIQEVYVHNNFHIDLTRFTKLDLLSIRFVQNEEQEKVGNLSHKEWLPHLVKHLRLPARVGSLLMRNMAFLDDSSAPALIKLFKKVTYQRLLLLDTNLTISEFREIMGDLVTGSRTASTWDAAATPPLEGVWRPRLQEAERKDRREHKPEGKELIVTSEVEIFENYSSAEKWPAAYHNFVKLVKAIESCPVLSINYSGKCVGVRKDVCGDLFMKCPLPFLDDAMVEEPKSRQELDPVLETLALAERISLYFTKLSYNGALSLLHFLKEKMTFIGRTEPFKLTIVSTNLTNCSMTKEELLCNCVEKIDKENKLRQFIFRCKNGCHFFKKTIDGTILFNDERLIDKHK